MNNIIKSESEVITFINQKVKLFSNGYIEIRDYKKCIVKIKSGYEKVDNDLITLGRLSANELIKNNKEIREDSLYRSRNILIDYVNENEEIFKSFITLTFKENITDLTYANKKFNTFVSSMRREFNNFKYIGVPEFQKRGAVHYHLLTNLEIGSEFIPIQEGKENMYDVKFWSYGYSSVFNLTTTDHNFNVVAYILKYLYKDLDNRLFGRTKVLKSNNLNKPIVIELENSCSNYNYAKNFLISNDINYTEKEIIPNQQYAIPFTLTTCKISNENINILKEEFIKKGKNI